MVTELYVFLHHVPKEASLVGMISRYATRLEKDYAVRVTQIENPPHAFNHSQSAVDYRLLNHIVREIGILSDDDELTIHADRDNLYIIKRSGT